MPKSNLCVKADRFRRMADTLTLADQKIIQQYADELEALAKREVVAPAPLALKGCRDELGSAVLADILKRAFPIYHDTVFQGLLTSLDQKG